MTLLGWLDCAGAPDTCLGVGHSAMSVDSASPCHCELRADILELLLAVYERWLNFKFKVAV